MSVSVCCVCICVLCLYLCVVSVSVCCVCICVLCLYLCVVSVSVCCVCYYCEMNSVPKRLLGLLATLLEGDCARVSIGYRVSLN